MKSHKWYQINNSVDVQQQKHVEVFIYDEIGSWGVSATAFLEDLENADDGKNPIVVAINSPGGNIFDGFAIHNALLRLGDRCIARIDGMAASAASVIACGASRVVMAENALMMIHEPWTITAGTANELRKTADMMDKTRDGINAAYRRKAPNLSQEELTKMLETETWLNASEALSAGFADEIGSQVQVAASLSSERILRCFKQAPTTLLECDEQPKLEVSHVKDNQQNIIQLARAYVAAGIYDLPDDIFSNVEVENDESVHSELLRVNNISTLCHSAKMTNLAPDFVKNRYTEHEVQAKLFELIIDRHSKEIDNKEVVKPTTAQVINVMDIYAKRKKKAIAVQLSRS